MTEPSIREPIRELLRLGPFPRETSTTPDQVRDYQGLLEQVSPPLNDQEAKELLSVFGEDDYFGLAWTLLHLIETAPSGPISSPPDPADNEWARRLWVRATNRRQ
jgi:hypothetical protein